MSDEPYRFAINPIVAEGNARRLVNVVAEFFPDGVRSEDLRIRYEQITNLRRASYFDSLAYCKHRGWIIGGGKGVPLRLNEDGSWRATRTSAEETLDRERLAHVVDLQTQKISELQGELERFSDANGAGIAVAALLGIVANANATVRQRVKAASTILSYKTEDDDAVGVAKKFLQSTCVDVGVPVDYRIEASEALRRSEDSRIVPSIERPVARTDNVEPAEKPIPLSVLLEQRRAYCDQRWREIEIEMPELRRYRANPPRDGDGDGEAT